MKLKNNWFDYGNILFMFILSLLMLYPFIYVLFTSISDQYAISSGIVKYYPSGINIEAYRMVFSNGDIGLAYFNSVRYASLGTVVFIIVTSIVSYPLAIKRFKPNRVIAMYYVLTMFINGGMIPTYLLYKALGLVNSMWVMILPSALGVFYIMVFKTFFQTMGTELIDAAYIDGANDLHVLMRIIMPLSKSIIATFSLFTIVGIWNNFFTPMLYLHEEHLQPLTIILRRMLIELDIQSLRTEEMLKELMEGGPQSRISIEAFRAATIIVTILPIVCIYPFIQRYFVKGVMIGSLKA